MKKILSLILALCMIFAFASLTACGGEDADGGADTGSKAPANSDTASTPSEENTNVFPEALTNVAAYPVANVEQTMWCCAGGMIDGVEMEEEDLTAIYTAMGGTFNFYFQDGNKIQLINGEKALDGTYTVKAESYIIDAVFEGYEYYGVFTQVNDAPVLIMCNKTDSTTAFYFSMIDEH